MSLKDLLQIIVKFLFVLGIAIIVVGVGICFTGIGAILGIPLVVLGVFVLKSRQYLSEIVNGGNITQNLFLYFSDIKKILIICFILIVAFLIVIGVGYFYFTNLFNNVIF